MFDKANLNSTSRHEIPVLVSEDIVINIYMFNMFSCLFILVGFLVFTQADNSVDERASTDRNEVELVIVVDYSAFKYWYDMTPSNETYNDRVSKTKSNMLEYIQSIFLSVNSVYKSLESHNIYIQIKVVDVIFSTSYQGNQDAQDVINQTLKYYFIHAADAPWTETTKTHKSSGYFCNPNDVLNNFGPYSRQLETTKPFDHAMTFTRYGLQKGDGPTLAGYAVSSAECTRSSVSVVRVYEGPGSFSVIAHELGHSLGCQHDGTNNNCSPRDGYIMASGDVSSNKTTTQPSTTPKTITSQSHSHSRSFSSCSVNYIRNYIDKLNRDNNNCLLTTQNHNPNPYVTNTVPKWYGELHKADEQCKLQYGDGSYVCRGLHHNNYTNICPMMACYLPKRNTCYFMRAADGTPCGDGKWCMDNACTTNSKALSVPDSCPLGDQQGIVMNGKTCKQLLEYDSYACFKTQVKYQCCNTCGQNTAGQSGASVSLDQQCTIKQGNGSFFCRGLPNYSVKDVSNVICSTLLCKVPTKSYCISSTAEDKTTCGNKMWCKSGVCVHDDSAPAVSENCIFGEATSSLDSHGLICQQLKLPENQWRCYGDSIKKMCCQTCPSIERNVTGCEFGDKGEWCRTHVVSAENKRQCYNTNTKAYCCDSCATYANKANKGCEYGDKSSWCHLNIRSESDKMKCYFGTNADMCCETCAGYANTAQKGCEYGDKLHGCKASMCSQYSAYNREKCCQTCKPGPAVG